MSIAYQWREATGTAVAMQLIESRADNLPPYLQQKRSKKSPQFR